MRLIAINGVLALAGMAPLAWAVDAPSAKIVEQVRVVIEKPDATTQAKDLAALAKQFPHDPNVLTTVGAAYLKIDQADDAKPVLEAALKSAGDKPSRDLIYNLGVCDLLQHTNAMRSIKLIVAYSKRADFQPDEPLQNLFGSLLSDVVKIQLASKSPLFKEAVTTYLDLDAKLEAGHAENMRRWGSSWMTADERSKIDETRADFRQKISDENAKLDEYVSAAKVAGRRLETAQVHARNGDGDSLPGAQAAFNKAAAKVDRQQDVVKELLAQVPRPSWPKEYAAIIPAPFGGGQETATDTTKVAATEDAPPAGQSAFEKSMDDALKNIDNAKPDEVAAKPEEATVKPEAAPEPEVKPEPEAKPVPKPVVKNKPRTQSPRDTSAGTSLFDF